MLEILEVKYTENVKKYLNFVQFKENNKFNMLSKYI